MFKKSKHEFTCPDVIYLRNRQKKINRYAIGANLVFYGGMFAGLKALEVRDDRRFLEEHDISTDA